MNQSVKIYQLVTPNIDSYAIYSVASVYSYAKALGYDYYIQREPLVHDMHINWTKIALLQQAANTSEGYSFFLDADTVLINPSHKLNQWVDLMGNKKSILMTKDTPLLKRHRPNAGLILINNSRGKKIIDHWMNAARNEGSHLADTHPRNQLVYWNYVQPIYRDEQQLISNAFARKYHWFVPYLSSNNQFVFHFTQSSIKGREKAMKDIYQKYYSNSNTLEIVKEALQDQQTGMIAL